MAANVDADEALARMGYQSELPRNMSMLSVLGLYNLSIYLARDSVREKEIELLMERTTGRLLLWQHHLA